MFFLTFTVRVVFSSNYFNFEIIIRFLNFLIIHRIMIEICKGALMSPDFYSSFIYYFFNWKNIYWWFMLWYNLSQKDSIVFIYLCRPFTTVVYLLPLSRLKVVKYFSFPNENTCCGSVKIVDSLLCFVS